jgi:hypothetical protein
VVLCVPAKAAPTLIGRPPTAVLWAHRASRIRDDGWATSLYDGNSKPTKTSLRDQLAIQPKMTSRSPNACLQANYTKNE